MKKCKTNVIFLILHSSFLIKLCTFAGGNYSPTTKNNGKTEKIHPSGE
jgi:hypothetical protein